MANCYQVLKSVGRLILLQTELPEWDYMVDIVLASVLRDAAYLADVVIAFYCPSSLFIPIQAIVPFMSTLPVGVIFSPHLISKAVPVALQGTIFDSFFFSIWISVENIAT